MSELEELEAIEPWPSKTEYEQGFEEWYGLGLRTREALDKAITLIRTTKMDEQAAWASFDHCEQERKRAESAALMWASRYKTAVLDPNVGQNIQARLKEAEKLLHLAAITRPSPFTRDELKHIEAFLKPWEQPNPNS